MWLQEIDPLTDKAYTDLILPPWPFWRACEAVGLPVMLLMLAVSEVRRPKTSVCVSCISPIRGRQTPPPPHPQAMFAVPCKSVQAAACTLFALSLDGATQGSVLGVATLLVSRLSGMRPTSAG